MAGTLEAANTVVMDPAAHAEMVDFGKMVVLLSSKTYAVRMAAVFMMSPRRPPAAWINRRRSTSGS